MGHNSEARGNAKEALLNLAIEGLRLARAFNRVLNKLDAGEGARYANQVRYFEILAGSRSRIQALDFQQALMA